MNSTADSISSIPAPFTKRVIAFIYDFLIAGCSIVVLIAILIAILLAFDIEVHAHSPLAYTLFILEVTLGGLYFTWFWCHSGQTIGMKVWHVVLTSSDNTSDSLSITQAILRYLLALLSWGTLGLGIVWMLFDKEKQPLHDRLVGTRMILLKPTP